jgi:hypothetical protein
MTDTILTLAAIWIALCALCAMCMIRAPMGFQDERGFHTGEEG